MGKVAIILTAVALFISLPALCKPDGKKKNKDVPVARAQLEKRYEKIDKDLKPSVKYRLSFAKNTLLDSVRKTPKSGDYYAMAMDEVKKQFSLTTAEQKEVLILYVLTSVLKEVEMEIEDLREKKADTSTIFSRLNVKANQIFDVLSTVLKGIKGVRRQTVRKIL